MRPAVITAFGLAALAVYGTPPSRNDRGLSYRMMIIHALNKDQKAIQWRLDIDDTATLVGNVGKEEITDDLPRVFIQGDGTHAGLIKFGFRKVVFKNSELKRTFLITREGVAEVLYPFQKKDRQSLVISASQK